MHTPTFKMPIVRQVWQLIQHGDYAFSINLRDTYLPIPNFEQHFDFLHFLRQHKLNQLKFLPLGLVTALRVFTSLTKPVLFLCQCNDFHVLIYLDDILALTHSMNASNRP